MVTILGDAIARDRISERKRRMARNTLSYRVLVLDPIPFADTEKTPAGEARMFQPIAVTLITGERDAVLVDPPMTIEQTNAVIKWVEDSGKRLTAIVSTHGHGDHWFGTAMVLKRFPEAKPTPPRERSRSCAFTATRSFGRRRWDKSFPGQIPDSPVVSTPAPGNVFQLEGHEVRFVEVGHSDTDKSSVIHVPSIGLVVAGDVVYNGYHQYLGRVRQRRAQGLEDCAGYRCGSETDSHRGGAQEQGSRGRSENDPGHAPVLGRRRTCQCCSHDAREFYDAMVRLYPDRKNRSALWFWGARETLQELTGLPAQGLRWLPVRAEERASHVIAAREAALAGDVVDRVMPLLHHHSGRFHTQTLDGLGGRAAGRCLECAAELARAEVRRIGQLLDGQRRTEVLLRVRQHVLDSVGCRGHLQQHGVLRLPSPATMVENHLLGNQARHVDSQVFFDHRERQIDSCAGAGETSRSEHRR